MERGLGGNTIRFIPSAGNHNQYVGGASQRETNRVDISKELA